MFRRRLLRTAVVGGVAYGVGHHMATKSAQQQQTDAQQNAQIADVQDQQAAQQQAPPPPPVYQQAPPPPQGAAPAESTGLTPDDFAQLKQLGQLHESGVLTDPEFEAAKQKILGI
jgi:hemolysin activation/secretion protein